MYFVPLGYLIPYMYIHGSSDELLRWQRLINRLRVLKIYSWPISQVERVTKRSCERPRTMQPDLDFNRLHEVALHCRSLAGSHGVRAGWAGYMD